MDTHDKINKWKENLILYIFILICEMLYYSHLKQVAHEVCLFDVIIWPAFAARARAFLFVHHVTNIRVSDTTINVENMIFEIYVHS